MLASSLLTAAAPYQDPFGKICKVFISYCGASMVAFAEASKQVLEQRYPALTVFLDDYSVDPAESAMTFVYESLRDAFVGKAARSLAPFWQ